MMKGLWFRFATRALVVAVGAAILTGALGLAGPPPDDKKENATPKVMVFKGRGKPQPSAHAKLPKQLQHALGKRPTPLSASTKLKLLQRGAGKLPAIESSSVNSHVSLNTLRPYGDSAHQGWLDFYHMATLCENNSAYADGSNKSYDTNLSYSLYPESGKRYLIDFVVGGVGQQNLKELTFTIKAMDGTEQTFTIPCDGTGHHLGVMFDAGDPGLHSFTITAPAWWFFKSCDVTTLQ
jgi:hypothetical protein